MTAQGCVNLITTKKHFVCKNGRMAEQRGQRGRKRKPTETKSLKVSLSFTPELIAKLREEVRAARARNLSDAASKLIWRALEQVQ